MGSGGGSPAHRAGALAEVVAGFGIKLPALLRSGSRLLECPAEFYPSSWHGR